MIGSPGTNWLATNVRTTAASRTGSRPSARRSAYDLTGALSPRRAAARAQLSVTVLNGRNRKGVSRTPWTFGFRSAICIRTTSGHVPQSVSSTCSAVW